MLKRLALAVLILVPAFGHGAETGASPKLPRVATLFKQADADRSGTLSRAEVEKSVPQLARDFDKIDANRDGQISRHELAAWNKAQRGSRRMSAAERFRHADEDGDGAISREEAARHAPRLAQKFDAIDTDRDGKLSAEELRAYGEAKRNVR